MSRYVITALVFTLGFAGCRDEAPARSPASATAAAPASATAAASAAATAAAPASATAPASAPASATAPARRPPAPDPHARGRAQLVENSGDPSGPLAYIVVEPAQAGPETPVVLALHGRGDNPDAFARLAFNLALPVRTIVVRAPKRFGRNGFQWYESGSAEALAQTRAAVADLATVVDKLRERYPGMPKPAVYGFSQGAVVALQAVVDRPDLFAAAGALSGYLMAAEPADPSPKGAPRPPVLVTAGRSDRVIPPERSEAAALALEGLGFAPRRLTFDGGHSVPPTVVEGLRAFLTQHVSTREP